MTAAISSFTSPPLPQASALPPAPQAHSGFAHMLSQRQALAHDAVQPKTPEPQAADEASAKPQATAKRPTATPAAGERAAPARAAKTPAAKAAEPTDGTQGKPATEKAAAADDAGPVDPALADWLAALHLPAAAPLPAEQAGAAIAHGSTQPGAGPESEDGHALATTGRPVAGLKVGGVAERGDAKQPVERLQVVRDSREKPDALAADASTSWQAAMERAAPVDSQPGHENPALAALGAAHASPTSRAAEPAAAAVAVSMPTPATAPEFAQSLGVQVSVLARDGVQKAELHLNPAEMGPISVQIALDGTQAQVNFGADSAATRQIIEGGLPELAAALREAGFTLSGGGVHSQARGRGEGDGTRGGEGSGRSTSSSETEVTAGRINARVSAGGVDLYA